MTALTVRLEKQLSLSGCGPSITFKSGSTYESGKMTREADANRMLWLYTQGLRCKKVTREPGHVSKFNKIDTWEPRDGFNRFLFFRWMSSLLVGLKPYSAAVSVEQKCSSEAEEFRNLLTLNRYLIIAVSIFIVIRNPHVEKVVWSCLYGDLEIEASIFTAYGNMLKEIFKIVLLGLAR
jgi:hypothetical protein